MSFNFHPLGVPKEITTDLIKETSQIAPRRICFSSCHKGALKKGEGSYLGKFSVPFKETIKSIFEYETELTLFSNLGQFWHSIKAGREEDLIKIEEFTNKYENIVFLRDQLDLSIALSENLSDQNELTSIGKLEYDAKYKQEKQSILDLSKICQEFISNTPFYCSADFVCAVPPSNPSKDSLPRNVIRQSKELIEKDISDHINWKHVKQPLKELGLEKKLLTLEENELLIQTDIKNKSIILMDDLYQSGTTVQYIAMKLKEAGASYIYGLSFVKARNDKDYV